MKTDHRNEAAITLLNRLVGKYTNDQIATLTALTIDGVQVHRLTDSRLPAWEVVEWCELGDLMVISFGDGAMQEVVRTHAGRTLPLAKDPWYLRARRQVGEGSWIEIMLNYRRSDESLSEAARGRVHAVTDALGLETVKRELWAFGARDRRWTVKRSVQQADGTEKLHDYS